MTARDALRRLIEMAHVHHDNQQVAWRASEASGRGLVAEVYEVPLRESEAADAFVYPSFFAITDASTASPLVYQVAVAAGFAKINGKIISVAGDTINLPNAYITAGGGTVGYLCAEFDLDVSDEPAFSGFAFYALADFLGAIPATGVRHLIGRVSGDSDTSPATITVVQDLWGMIVDSIYQDCPT